MNTNVKKLLFGDRQAESPPVLLAVTPPRNGERTLLGVENMLQSIAVPEPFSLELAGDVDGVTLLARCQDDRVVRGQISAHYPQARIRQVPVDEDPIFVHRGEEAWGMTLRADGPEYVPLRTFRDDDLLDPGSDPLIALMGSLCDLKDGERVVSRLLLRSLGPSWSQAHQEKGHKRAVEERRDPSYTYKTGPLRLDGVTMAALGVAAVGALQGYLWVRDGEIWKAVLLGTGTALGLAVAGWGWRRWKQARNRVYDPLLIREKVARIAFDAEVQVVAFLPDGAGPQRAEEVLGRVAAAYRHYDHPRRGQVQGEQGTTPGPCGEPPARRAGPLRPAQRPGRAGGGVPVAPAGSAGRVAPGGALRPAGAAPLGPGSPGRRPGGTHHGGPGPGDTLPRGPVAPPPPLRRPNPHGQVHPDAPRRGPQAQGEGRR